VSLASHQDLREEQRRKQTINSSRRSNSDEKYGTLTDSSTFLAFTEESKNSQPEAQSTEEGPTNTEALRLEMMKSNQRNRQGSQRIISYNNELMKPRKARALVIASVIFWAYQAMAILFYYLDELKFSHGSGQQDLMDW